MKLAVERNRNSLYVIEEKTNLVICQLPGIMNRTDIKSVMKCLSILLKGLGNAAGKRKKVS